MQLGHNGPHAHCGLLLRCHTAWGGTAHSFLAERASRKEVKGRRRAGRRSQHSKQCARRGGGQPFFPALSHFSSDQKLAVDRAG